MAHADSAGPRRFYGPYTIPRRERNLDGTAAKELPGRNTRLSKGLVSRTPYPRFNLDMYAVIKDLPGCYSLDRQEFGLRPPL
jgi:hypothetical protein